jgi:hypothetical protein
MCMKRPSQEDTGLVDEDRYYSPLDYDQAQDPKHPGMVFLGAFLCSMIVIAVGFGIWSYSLH